MLTIKNIFFAWDKDYLFENISCQLSESEIIQIKGENGTGKTTLLQLISGMIPHFNQGKVLKGDILLNGKSLTKNSPKMFFPEIAFIPTTNIDFFLLTDCLKYEILLSFSMQNISQKIVDKKMAEFYQFFPLLKEIIDEPYERLTFNQKLLALTFVYYLQGAKIYLFDEVLNGFSKSEIETWYLFFEFLSSQNCSVAFIDHHLKSNNFKGWLLKNKKIKIV